MAYNEDTDTLIIQSAADNSLKQGTKATADPDDLILVQRGDTLYQAKVSDLPSGPVAPPTNVAINLKQDAVNANRFTSNSFTTEVTGNDIDDLELKGEVTGALGLEAATLPITNNAYPGTDSTEVVLTLADATNLDDQTFAVGDVVKSSASHTLVSDLIESVADATGTPTVTQGAGQSWTNLGSADPLSAASKTAFDSLGVGDNVSSIVYLRSYPSTSAVTSYVFTDIPQFNDDDDIGIYFRKYVTQDRTAPFTVDGVSIGPGTNDFSDGNGSGTRKGRPWAFKGSDFPNNTIGTLQYRPVSSGADAQHGFIGITINGVWLAPYIRFNLELSGEKDIELFQEGDVVQEYQSDVPKTYIGYSSASSDADLGVGSLNLKGTETFGVQPSGGPGSRTQLAYEFESPLVNVDIGHFSQKSAVLDLYGSNTGIDNSWVYILTIPKTEERALSGDTPYQFLKIVRTDAPSSVSYNNYGIHDSYIPPNKAKIVSTDVSAKTITVDGGDWREPVNQSKVWSNGLTGDIRPSDPATNAFDGDLNTYCASVNQAATQTLLLGEDFTGTLEFYNRTMDGTVRAKKGATLIQERTFAASIGWENITTNASAFDRIEIESGPSSIIVWAAFRINGQVLLDSGVTVDGDTTVSTLSPKQGEGTISNITGNVVTIEPYTDNCFKEGDYLIVNKTLRITPKTTAITGYDQGTKTISLADQTNLLNFENGDSVYMCDANGDAASIVPVSDSIQSISNPTYPASSTGTSTDGVTQCFDAPLGEDGDARTANTRISTQTNNLSLKFNNITFTDKIEVLGVSTYGASGSSAAKYIGINGGGEQTYGFTPVTSGSAIYEMQTVATASEGSPGTLTSIEVYGNTGGNFALAGVYVDGIRLTNAQTILTLSGTKDLAYFRKGDVVQGSSIPAGTTYKAYSSATELGSFSNVSDFTYREVVEIGSKPTTYGGAVRSLLYEFDEPQPNLPFVRFDGEAPSGANPWTMQVSNTANGTDWVTIHSGITTYYGPGDTRGSSGPTPYKFIKISNPGASGGGISFNKYGIDDTLLDQQVHIIDINESTPSITVDGGDWYADPANGGVGDGTVDGETEVTGPSKSGSGTFDSADAGNNTMLLSASNDVWPDGYYVATAEKDAVSMTAYLDFDGNGQNTQLTSIPQSGVNMNNIITPQIFFPVEFNTGEAPDTDIPAGSYLQTKVVAKNVIGSTDELTSNVVVPATTTYTAPAAGSVRYTTEEFGEFCRWACSSDYRTAIKTIQDTENTVTEFRDKALNMAQAYIDAQE